MSRKNYISSLALGLVLLTGCLNPGWIHAQDALFSNLSKHTVNLNPAHSGIMEKDNRFSAFYRDQWRSISSPYMTSALSYERKVHSSEKELVGMGLHAFYDQAGDGNLSTLKVNFSAAYGMHLNEDKQLLSIGLRLGYGRRSVDLDKLLFSSQGGDPSVGSGEVFNEKFHYFDFGVGLALQNKIQDKHELTFGIAVDNLSNPANSFNGEERTRFVRVTTYITGEIAIEEDWSLLPGFYFVNQNSARQYMIQFLARHTFNTVGANLFIEFGTYYRANDAVIPAVAIGYGGFELDFTYDVNISSLTDASNGKGAFEIGLQFAF